MDGFEINKIVGAFFGAVLAVLGINEIAKILYHVEEPTQKGYVVEGVEENGGGTGTTTEVPVVETLPDFGTVLASADLAQGQSVAAKCVQCHTWDQGGPNKIGPNLYGIVGAPHAHLGDGFAYSAAMRETPGNWDYEGLYRFLENPKKHIPGTKMAFAGLRKSEERIALIAYMRTWSASPFPLPAPNPVVPVEGAPVEGAVPVEGAPAEGAPADGATPPATPAEAPATAPVETPAPAAGGGHGG